MEPSDKTSEADLVWMTGERTPVDLSPEQVAWVENHILETGEAGFAGDVTEVMFDHDISHAKLQHVVHEKTTGDKMPLLTFDFRLKYGTLEVKVRGEWKFLVASNKKLDKQDRKPTWMLWFNLVCNSSYRRIARRLAMNIIWRGMYETGILECPSEM